VENTRALPVFYASFKRQYCRRVVDAGVLALKASACLYEDARLFAFMPVFNMCRTYYESIV